MQCQFWDGWGLSTPPSWDTKLWCTQNQAEMFRKKIKFGDLPRWVRSCLKQKPKQSWKLPLCSCEPSLVPANYRSWRVLEPWEYEVEMSNRKVISRHLFSEKHRGLLPQFGQEDNGFGRPFNWSFQVRWLRRWPLNWPEQTSRAVSHWKCLILGPLGHWFFRWWEEETEDMGFGWWFWLTNGVEKVRVASWLDKQRNSHLLTQ